MGEMRVLNDTGDVTVSWDPDDAESVGKAEQEFARLKADGYAFYETVQTKGKAVEEFDPKIGSLIAAPGGRSATDKATGSRAKAMAGGPLARSVRTG